MMDDIAAEIAALDQMSTGDLAERYAELHGQRHRTHRSERHHGHDQVQRPAPTHQPRVP